MLNFHRIRYPTKTVENKTPFEAFNGKMPRIKHLKVFGSTCYCNIPLQLRQKLNENTVKDIFIEYGKAKKDYMIYSLETKKIFLSISVIFDENGT